MGFVKNEHFWIILLLVATASLRFINLSYSDYISDEPGTFLYRGGKKTPAISTWEFFMNERKGPLQIIVGFIPYSIVGNYKNELAQRIPFSLFSLAAVFVFYQAVKELTKDVTTALISAALLSFNGLITAYGRIAQYQNLNLFFSFAALYLYVRILLRRDSPSQGLSLFLAPVALSLSLLAHWDAVYILIPVSLIFVNFLLSRKFAWQFKAKVVAINVLVISLIVAPFMVPYLKTYLGNPDNQAYAMGIVGSGHLFEIDIKQFFLYNPFLTYWIYVAGAVFGLVVSFWKTVKEKSMVWIFPAWFLVILIISRFLISYAGLHFYNVFIPVTILCGIAVSGITGVSKRMKYILLLAVLGLLSFFYYQSYILFVDHFREYPMEVDKVLWLETKDVEHSDNLRHRTGFPHKRYWQEINDWINKQNRVRHESFGYTTNEFDSLSRFYMDSDRRTDNGFYAVGIKNPLSLSRDYKFPQIKNKHTAYQIKNDYGETVARIYRIEP